MLVLPGLLRRRRGHRAGCAAHLDKLGYRSYGWGLGRNHGLTDAIVDGVLARLEEVHERHDEPVSLVGWSFGGLLAR